MLTHANTLMPQTELFKEAFFAEPQTCQTSCLISCVQKVEVEISPLYLAVTFFLPYI